jgi:cyclopropane fatty-acyl-phospholipid synthase-like methyltransferase
MSDPRTKLVGAGYDAMADTWEDWSSHVTDDPRHEWLERLVAVLPPAARVVELGCGNGTRETRELAVRTQLTGVDLSEEQLRRARERVPGAEFVHGDLTSIEFAAGSLDAVASFYVFNHVPRERLAGLLSKIHRWLVPGGWSMHAFGTSDTAAWTGEWLGAPNFFSSFTPETNSRLVREAGFEIVRDELVTFMEPEGEATFQWVLARST